MHFALVAAAFSLISSDHYTQALIFGVGGSNEHWNIHGKSPSYTTPLTMTTTASSSNAASTTALHSPPNEERYPNLRNFDSSSLASNRLHLSMEEYTKNMEERAQECAPLTDDELDMVIHSLMNVTPNTSTIDFDQVRTLLEEIAHLSHKDWTRTGQNSQRLQQLLIPKGMSCPLARQMVERIVMEGNWDGAARHATSERTADQSPWAVLVTGVNGIRKTTSIYQPWFAQLLSEALVPPSDAAAPQSFPLSALPVGSNTFFRQLDHMIATLCNEDFASLYAYTEQKLHDNGKNAPPPQETIKLYSDFKAAIFSRYRTLSELLGVMLLREAQDISLNCMMETSGRDIAMFHYVDQFFPSSASERRYNKLALHFTINDLSCAQQSVDARMVREIQTGMQALASKHVVPIIYANAGGPYGSEVLPGVQEASDRVWNDVVLAKGGGTSEVGLDWYKATIAINAHPTAPWTAQAVRPDGSLGTVFTFVRN